MKFIGLDCVAINRKTIYRGLPNYPGRLTGFLGDQAPQAVSVVGNLEILQQVDSGAAPSLGLIASVNAPSQLVDSVLTLIGRLSEAKITFVGGFHSPLERSCLEILLKSDQQVLLCMARTLADARVPVLWQRPLTEGRLLILSSFSDAQKRPTVESSRIRNACVTALASRFLIPYASQGSKTENLFRSLVKQGKPVWVLDKTVNKALLNQGGRPAGTDFVKEMQLAGVCREFSAN